MRKHETSITAVAVIGARDAGHAGHRAHQSRRRDLADSAIVRISHKKISRRVHGDMPGRIKGRSRSQPIIRAFKAPGHRDKCGGGTMITVATRLVTTPAELLKTTL